MAEHTLLLALLRWWHQAIALSPSALLLTTPAYHQPVRSLPSTRRQRHRRLQQLPSPLSQTSEERQVGKACRSRWAPFHLKKKAEPTLLLPPLPVWHQAITPSPSAL